MDKPSRKDALAAVETLIRYIGDDPERQALIDTPERVIRAWEREWGVGYQPQPDLLTLFDEDESIPDTMVLLKGIAVHSMCAHHMVPFHGTADVAYLPDPVNGIVGLSKLARIVDHFARRLQTQETLCAQIADFIRDKISADCGVIIRAKHLCIGSRGVHQPGAEAITSALRGEFLDNEMVRGEFMALFNRSGSWV